MRLAIRGWADGKQVFEDLVDAEIADMETLAEKQGKRLLALGGTHMIEIEFLDEPNPNERFFRFGTDPRGMRLPFEIDITKL